jgi:Septum formation
MSTEATGDGRPETADAIEPAAGTVGAVSAAPPAGESDEPGEPGESGQSGELGEPEDYEEHADDEASEFAVDEGFAAEADLEDDGLEDEDDGLEDEEVLEYDETLEYDEAFEYDEDYEPGADAEPRRARRWPRLLLAGGFVVLAAVIVGGAIAIVGSVTHGFKKPVKVTYKTSAVFSLKTGDCFDPQGAQSYTLVSCDAPHDAEVFATFPLTGTAWPGASAVQAKASGGCASRLTGYVNPQLAISLTSTYVYPDSVAWQAGTRSVICEVRATTGQLTGSVRGATASASASAG